MSDLIFSMQYPGPEKPVTHLPVDLGTQDFTLALRARWCGDEAGSGDLISQFDPRERRGFTLGITSLGAACVSQAHLRKLSFGIDAGTEPIWMDLGNPAGRAVYPFALVEFRGEMYAGVYVGDEGVGGVYRFDERLGWVDCGCPCVGNAITAMAVHDGRLYVGASCYDARGTHLAAAKNQRPDGHVFAYDGHRWSDCGRPAECAMVSSMATLGGELYVTMMTQYTRVTSHPANGLYRLAHPGKWAACGNPGERVVPLLARGGKLMAGGFEKGAVYAYDPQNGQWETWGRPPFAPTSQIYSFVEYQGELLAGTWRIAKVFAVEGPGAFRDLGALGAELEVMPMALFNGKLYAGTLPLAQIYRFEEEMGWRLIDRLDHTDTEYRRACAMAVGGGYLYCGAAPSGRIYRMSAGRVASAVEPWAEGWHDVAAIRRGHRLELYVDGMKVAEHEEPRPWRVEEPFNLSTTAPLVVGDGPAGKWQGDIGNISLYRRALSAGEIEALRVSGGF